MTSPTPWLNRDLPVLVAVAPLIDTNPTESVSASAIAEQTKLSHGEVLAALVALSPTYVQIWKDERAGGLVNANVTALTDEGRRSAGLWPSQDEHLASLIKMLQAAADQTSDKDEQTLLRKIGRGLAEAPGTVVSGVITAWLSGQIG